MRYSNFWLFVAALVGVTAVLGRTMSPARSVLIGFDAGAVLFVARTLWMFRGADADDMRRRARENDPDHHVLLLIALLIVAVVLVAVTVELTGAGGGKGSAVALSGVTLLLAWLFANLLFALHYAHRFYTPGADGAADSGGLAFPGDDLPDYGDFAYFAFVLGMTFQVSDVDITARPMRRLALYHSLTAFVFNIVVVALSVSLIGSLVEK